VAGEAPLAAGLLAGLAVWCRPDTLLGAAVLGLLLWRESPRLPGRYAPAAGLVIAAGLAAAHLWFGRFLPVTLEAKRLQASLRPQTWKAGWNFWGEELRLFARPYAGDRTMLLVAAGAVGLWPLLRHGGRTGRLLGLYAVV